MTIALTKRLVKGSELTAAEFDGNMTTIEGAVNTDVTGIAIHAATTKATPVDADELGVTDSAASFVLKRLTWANLKATLKTYFDTLYPVVAYKTIAVSGTGGPLVANSITDTLTLAAGANVTINATAGTDTITIAATGGAGGNTFSTVTAGGTTILADSTSDTLAFAAGTGITLAGDSATDTVTITNAGPSVAFSTIAVTGTPGQSPVIAEIASDTLTFNASTGMTISTTPGTDTITFTAAGGGGGSGSYAAMPAISADTNITSSHMYNLLLVSGTGVDLTLVETSWTANAWVDIAVVGTTTVNLTAGTNGINQAGNDTVILYPNTLVRVAFRTATDPMWVMGYDESLTLTANTFAVANNAGTALEARAQKFNANWSANITSNGTYPVALHGDVPVTLNEVTARTVGGTCSYKLQKNGVDYQGHGTAIPVVSGSKVDTACTETLAEDNLTTLVVTAASSLTGLYVTIKGTRTGA